MESTKNQLNVNELLSVLWAKKIFIGLFSGLFAAVAIIYSLGLPNIYQSNVILTISENQSSTSNNSSALSSLTSSFGVDVGSNDQKKDKIAVSIMSSWGLAEDLIKDNAIEPILAASIGWDQETNKLIFDNDIYDDATQTWKQQKTSWQLFQKLKGITEIRYDTKDKFIYLAVESYSPSVAKDLVDMYVSTINQYMRDRQIVESENNLSYLQAQLSKIKNNNLKQVFYNLILKENREKMLAEASPEYMFVTVSRAMVPEVKSKPLRSIIVMSLTGVGFLLTCIFILIRNNLTGRKEL